MENKNLAICACIISFLLLLLIGLGIFLLNKLIRPVIINTTVNNHYGIMNMTNTTAIIPTRSTISTPLIMILRRSSTDILSTRASTLLPDEFALLCPPNLWGIACEKTCKPCGLGVCHPITGKCVCPADIYGEFCDLWKSK